MLIVFAGLPGTGKTTIARLLARALRAPYLRIDSIEVVAYRVAADNLRLGLHVVADCVNPLKVSRDAWRATARAEGQASTLVEVICSDRAEHERRLGARTHGAEGQVAPTWAADAQPDSP